MPSKNSTGGDALTECDGLSTVLNTPCPARKKVFFCSNLQVMQQGRAATAAVGQQRAGCSLRGECVQVLQCYDSRRESEAGGRIMAALDRRHLPDSSCKPLQPPHVSHRSSEVPPSALHCPMTITRFTSAKLSSPTSRSQLKHIHHPPFMYMPPPPPPSRRIINSHVSIFSPPPCS